MEQGDLEVKGRMKTDSQGRARGDKGKGSEVQAAQREARLGVGVGTKNTRQASERIERAEAAISEGEKRRKDVTPLARAPHCWRRGSAGTEHV